MKLTFKAIMLLAMLYLPACSYNVKNTENLAKIRASIAPSSLDIATDNLATLDHASTTAAIICSAHTFNLPISKQLSNSLEALDQDGILENNIPDVRVTGQRANSTFKCIQTGMMSGKCEGTVNMSVSVSDKKGRSKTFTSSKSSIKPNTGCDGVSGSLEEASAETIAEIINKIRAYD